MLKKLVLGIGLGLASFAATGHAAITATVQNGTLQITGNGDDETVRLRVGNNGIIVERGGGGVVTIDGNAWADLEQISLVSISTRGGRDDILIDPTWHQQASAIPVTINAGSDGDFIDLGTSTFANNVTVLGGSGPDEIVVYFTWRWIQFGNYVFPVRNVLSKSLDDFNAAEGDRNLFKYVLVLPRPFGR